MSHFVRQTSFDVKYAPSKVSKWRSSKTGLQVTCINHPLPMVNGYFAVGTEIDNDCGAPHTLEHLVFMGSKNYPYKGLMDSLSNRFFSTTNAWTAVDQTVYTLSTAGWEGFNKLLPVYLDHLFNPTLTDEACRTEVYHIDGEGKEKGVVFSEMQGMVTEADFILSLALHRGLYAPQSGYLSEVGGLLPELRDLTNDQIRKFHKAMYRPENTCVIVTGSVDEEELMATMAEIDKLLPPLSPSKKRPFVDLPEDLPLNEESVKRVSFPERDESIGEVAIGWIGPKADNHLVNLALDMIGSYLTDSPISIFNKAFVEIVDPWATRSSFFTLDYLRTGIEVRFGGVPVNRLEEIVSRAKAILKEQTTVDNFDLQYMRRLINQLKLEHISDTECSPEKLYSVAIRDFLYGKPDGSGFQAVTENLTFYDELAEWSAEQWCATIKEYLVNNKSVAVLGVPSNALNKRQKTEMKEIAQKIQDENGPEGLAKLGDLLEKAQAKNNINIPNSVLTLMGSADALKIKFISLESYRAGANALDLPIYKHEKTLDNFKHESPLFLHFENFESRFCEIHLVVNASQLPKRLMPYFEILTDIFSMPVRTPDGKVTPYETVVSEMNQDLISYRLASGLNSTAHQLIRIELKFDTAKYDAAINWLVKLFKYSFFDADRVKVLVENFINSLPQVKRDDELMIESVYERFVFTDESLRKNYDYIQCEQFYLDVQEKLKDGRLEEIVRDLNEIRSTLFGIDNVKAFVFGGVSKLENPVEAWDKFAEHLSKESLKFGDIPRDFELKSEMAKACSRTAVITPLLAGESLHLKISTPIPTDYLDEDNFKISLAAEILQCVEGPFWRGIRGTGLAYGAYVLKSVEDGFLTFAIYRGADPQEGLEAAKKIVNDYASGAVAIDQVTIENAIASIVRALVSRVEENYQAAMHKVVGNIFENRGDNYLTYFLSRLRLFTPEDVVYVLKKYFVPMFEAKSSILFAVLPTGKVPSFRLYVEGSGYEVEMSEIPMSGDVESESDSGSDIE